MADALALLTAALGADRVTTGAGASDDYFHDESLTTTPVTPAVVVTPTSTDEVAVVLRIAHEHRIPVIARGSGTGMSGAALPTADGILVSFERMNQVLEVDTENHMAVVQPGVTLRELDEAIAPHGLVYPVYPGELSASLGGNVATNAGGMRAVKYGVTRHHVLGLEAVLPGGEVMRTGGRIVKSSTGYDLTQLLIGSEGTLALITEVTIKLQPRAAHQATLLAPFATLDEIAAAVPKIVASGINPVILEYIDMLTLAATSDFTGLELGIPDEVRSTALAYAVVMLEGNDEGRLDEDAAALGARLTELGAIDVYVLPPQAATQLIEAREKAFFVAKANGAHDIVDVVVPRAGMAEFLTKVAELAQESGSFVGGCGHAGDGNVHLGVFQPDADARYRLMHQVFELGMSMGGAISGEHGIGTEKMRHYLELEQPAKIALQRRIKQAFDPHAILNPGTVLGDVAPA